ncbi:AAA family ATPase [Aeromonas veronii]
MIKRFGFKNFYSFKEGTEVNFMLDGNVPSDIKNGRDFTTVLGIKGANGSGKTNLIKALEFLKVFCTNQKNIAISEPLDVNSFNNSQEPCEFYIEFTSNNTSYYYEAEVTTKEVIRESLYRKKTKLSPLFQREKNELSYLIKELTPLKYITLNKNTSVIGLANKLSLVSELAAIKDVYDFFSRIFTNVDSSGFWDFSFSLQMSSKEYYKHPEIFEFVKDIIKKADSGIKDIEVRKR